MKKLIMLLVVAAMVTPAMAVVEFDGDRVGDTITIEYNCTEGEEPRGMALLLTCSDTLLITGGTGIDVAYNCFLDYAYSNDPYALGDGDPFADPAGPGAVDVSSGVAEVSICMGVLDETGNQGAGPGVATVIELSVTGTGTLTVAADTLRGPDSGVVGSELASNLPIDIGGTPPICMMDTHPDYAAWVTYGMPNCWCYRAQCNGDVDGATELGGTVNVFMGDLNIFVPSFGSMQTAEPGVCADLDHGTELGGTVNVFMNDLNIFVPAFGSLQPDCDATHINFWLN